MFLEAVDDCSGGHSGQQTIPDASGGHTKSTIADSVKLGLWHDQFPTGRLAKTLSRACVSGTLKVSCQVLGCHVVPTSTHQYSQLVFDAFRKRQPLQFLILAILGHTCELSK